MAWGRTGGTLAGAGIGGVLGGPMGASIGAGIGAGAGGMFDDGDKRRAMRDYLSELQGVQRPEDINYLGISDPEGNLGANYELAGSSPWVQAAMAKQQQEQQKLTDQAASQSAGAAAGARSSLAMKGGLRGGAAERIAKSSARDIAGAQQDVGMAGALSRADIGLQGENLQRQANMFNIGNRIGDKQARNEFEANKYNQKMASYAAAQTARAQMVGSGSGGGGKK